MKKRLSTLQFPAWTFPLALLVVCLLSFGLLAPQLGFYWDDWAKTAVNVLHGFSGYKAYYAVDRPLLRLDAHLLRLYHRQPACRLAISNSPAALGSRNQHVVVLQPAVAASP